MSVVNYRFGMGPVMALYQIVGGRKKKKHRATVSVSGV